MKHTHETFYFASSADAWDFMRFVDQKEGMIAGFPSLKPQDDGMGRKSYTVDTVTISEKDENQ